MTDLTSLQAVIPGTRVLAGNEQAAPEIRGLSYDSRRTAPGDLFFCVRGRKSDGLQFLPAAVARGAVAAVVEGDPADLPVPVLVVPNVREAMPRLATAFYGYPSRRLSLVGVTGTNGKTTTTYLVEALARAAGRDTGVIGTIETRINRETIPGDRTTPESPDLQELLARMADTGDSMVVAMEASSHALALGRTTGCEFDVAVFTNLTQDHLDFHKDMEDYFQAKALLFTRYPEQSAKPFTAVINADDPYGRRLAGLARGTVVTYGVHEEATLRASEIEASPRGLTFRITAPEGVFPIRVRLGGLFNVYNTLGAVGAARSLGISWDVIVPALEASSVVPGRFEAVDEGQPFGVVVDYAHTPDGLENVLQAARALRPRRVIAVFGCGGDRDRTKRPIMGRIAADLAERVIVTSDNPRSEDPQSIVEEILTGIPAERRGDVEAIVDRRQAIRHAIAQAEPEDLVVLAGKGHETYQIFTNGTVHFDDREEARDAIHARLSD